MTFLTLTHQPTLTSIVCYFDTLTGSALSLGAGIVPLFKQLGIYDEFVAIAKPYNEMRIFNDKLKPEYTMDCSWGAA